MNLINLTIMGLVKKCSQHFCTETPFQMQRLVISVDPTFHSVSSKRSHNAKISMYMCTLLFHGNTRHIIKHVMRVLVALLRAKPVFNGQYE